MMFRETIEAGTRPGEVWEVEVWESFPSVARLHLYLLLSPLVLNESDGWAVLRLTDEEAGHVGWVSDLVLRAASVGRRVVA